MEWKYQVAENRNTTIVPFRGWNYHSSSLEYCVRCFCFCLPVYTFQSSRRFIDMIYLPSYNSGLHNERDVCKPCQSTQKEQTVFFLQTYMFQWCIFWICIWVKVNSSNKMVIIAWSPAAVCLVRFDGWKNPWATRFQTATLPHSSRSYGGPLGTRNSFSKHGFIHNSFQYFY